MKKNKLKKIMKMKSSLFHQSFQYYFGLVLVFFFTLGEAQIPISLSTACEKAINRNPEIQSSQLKIEYQEKIKTSYAVVDPLNISGEIGQFNSDKTDNKISVSQGFRLPNFYKSQKAVLAENLKSAEIESEISKWQLKKQIALVYNELVYLDEKEKLLQKTDSIYRTYFQRAELRLKKGESNILEKTTAENYRSQATIQLQNLLKDREITLQQFNYLINSEEKYQNEKENFFSYIRCQTNEDFTGNAWVIKQLEQQKQIENAKLKAEKSKLSPSFSLGISSMTINVDTNGKRYQSGILGIGIPLFNSAQKSVIEGQKINQQIAETQLQIGLRKIKNQYLNLKNEYQKIASEQEYYKTKGLANSKTIFSTANRLFYQGEINYLEWSILVNQALEIENKYIDNQNILNQKSIEINSLKEI